MTENAEQQRLGQSNRRERHWKRWGPYLSERQWGTVREDYSADGEAWDYFTYEMARYRAYRWGEDGIGGISDSRQRLCLSFAFWNGRDTCLKERLFGLTGPEGNHGEDVKEYYYYLDATPTHSYLKMLYKYPQRAFPYEELRCKNAIRTREEPEYELLDTGIFDDDRYFDVVIEYAKVDTDDILVRVIAHNRSRQPADLHLVPTLWFRNTWSWGRAEGVERPRLTAAGLQWTDDATPRPRDENVGSGRHIEATHPTLSPMRLYWDGDPRPMFCENDTNHRALCENVSTDYCRYDGPYKKGYFKDGLCRAIAGGDATAVNPRLVGTKAGLHYRQTVPPMASMVVRLRLTDGTPDEPLRDFDKLFQLRQREADEFYADLQQGIEDDDQRHVQRQALAGMVWNKQFYCYDVPQWLQGDPEHPAPPPERKAFRNAEWFHFTVSEIHSMPDAWEYPWFAAWDQAFHTIPLAMIDPEFAKRQLLILTREWYMHPNGQIPAYEWDLSDVNPPVHAWAAWRVYKMEMKERGGRGDRAFLERIFQKLMINFTWWVNRKDAHGLNIFQGGFLGLDNIGVFDRSKPLPMGGHINQADGTSWMAVYCLSLMRMAIELAMENPVYEDIASKFFEHFLYIARAMTNIGGEGIGLWDEEDEFYYDAISLPDGRQFPVRLRSIVGLIPLFAVEVLEPEMLERLPGFTRRMHWFLNHRGDLASLVSRWEEPGRGHRHLLSLLRGHRMKCLLRRMLDEDEFLSPYGVRSLSRTYRDTPYFFDCCGKPSIVEYLPGESTLDMFGGNSNWRGPIWPPINYLIVESLQKFHHYYGDDFKIECPTGSGKFMTIRDAADEIARRLINIFLKDKEGHRPVFAQYEKLRTDPNFRDHVLFFEHFHGDTGRGVGASHQTGWTGLVAKLIQPPRE